MGRDLLSRVAQYITQLMQMFGAVEKEQTIGFPQGGSQSANVEETVMPYLSAFAEFRDQVRSMARECKATNILSACDRVRDDTLPPLGVRLEDHEGAPTAIKLVDP